MAIARRKRKTGLIELAGSDWKVGAGMAGFAVAAALIGIPTLIGSQPMLQGLVPLVTALAWFLAALFGAIAAFGFTRQRAGRALRHTSVKGIADVAIKHASAPSNTAAKQWVNEPTPISAPQPVKCPTAWSMDVLDRVEWKRFEDLCCAFYREHGIAADTTRLGADGGVDIRLHQDTDNPERTTAIVQCKALARQVGVATVRELRGVMAHEQVEKGFFMAPNGFTDDARTFAAANRITLLDGKLFLAMLDRMPDEAADRLLQFATEGDWTTPTCPSCGTKMIARDGRRGPFWGCPTYPACRGMMPMRKAATAG